MKYHNITHDDMLNGDGLRVVLWVSGCTHQCKGCQNPITWDCNVGLDFDEEAKQEIFTELNKDYISGITFSGGDPLHLNNIDEVIDLAKEIKEKFPNKTIWLYTGWKWEFLYSKTIYRGRDILPYLDVLVDDRFELNKRDVNLYWRGSSNQKVIDVQESLKQNKVVLYCE